jgi:hypothetical protein
MGFLGRDADRAVVGVAGAHGDATNGLYGSIGDRNGIGTQRHGLDEVGRFAQAAGDDQRDVTTIQPIQMASGPGKCRNGRDRDVVAEDDRGSTGAAATPIQDDVIDADLKRGINILFDMLGRKLLADRDAAGAITHFVGEVPDLAYLGPVGET